MCLREFRVTASRAPTGKTFFPSIQKRRLHHAQKYRHNLPAVPLLDPLPCIRRFYLPDTGQTKCYDAAELIPPISSGTGQDGAHIINPMSYTDNNRRDGDRQQHRAHVAEVQRRPGRTNVQRHCDYHRPGTSANRLRRSQPEGLSLRLAPPLQERAHNHRRLRRCRIRGHHRTGLFPVHRCPGVGRQLLDVHFLLAGNPGLRAMRGARLSTMAASQHTIIKDHH